MSRSMDSRRNARSHFRMLIDVPSRVRQDELDRAREEAPVGLLGGELLPALDCQAIELRPAPFGRDAPFRLDPAGVLEPVESGVERALVDLKDVLGDLADALG